MNGSRKLQVTANFAIGEDQLECSCCGEILFNDLFWRHMSLLQALRGRLGPIEVTSGHRCEKHNADVGGAPKSMHKEFATDLKPRLASLERTYAAAKDVGFTGLGRYNSFLHVDCRDLPAEWDNRSG